MATIDEGLFSAVIIAIPKKVKTRSYETQHISKHVMSRSSL